MKNYIPDYPSIVLENPKFPRNVSAVLRLASCFGIGQLWYTGQRMERLLSGMDRLPREERMKGYKDVDLIGVEHPFDFLQDGVPVVVELVPGAVPLPQFQHPENAVYIFGPEDGSVSKGLRVIAHHFVVIPSRHCLNLATAVAIVIAHRAFQFGWVPDTLTEYRVPVDFAGDVELG